MPRDLGPYVGSLLEKHFSGEDKQVRVEDAGVDFSEVMKKRGRLDDPSIYFSQTIGGHPDYQHLLATSQVEKGAITTLFADLKNFSARGMFVDPTSIKGVKRQVLGTWIDSVRIMGGHVHSIDGDGIMVFFGGRDRNSTYATYEAVAAGINVLTLTREVVNPLLQDRGHEPVELRVGIDHDPNMRWGRIGIPDHYEVKGTGFGIDFAAKMMQSRRSGFVMVGETLVDLIAIPEDFLEVHTYQQNGEDVKDPGFERTHRGNTKRYKKRRLDLDRLFREVGGDQLVVDEDDIRHICTSGRIENRNVSPAPATGSRTHPENEEFAQGQA